MALLLSGMFSAAETALMSINRAKLRAQLDAGDRTARRIQALIQRPRRLLSTILLGNTLAIVTAGVVGDTALYQLLGMTPTTGGLAIVLITLLVVVFGEVAPKSIAAAHADRVAGLVAGPIQVAMLLFRPVIAAILTITTPLVRILGGQEALASPRYTEDELRMLLEIGQEQGVIEQDESELVSSALAFDDTPVSAVLTPRVDIVAVPLGMTLAELVEVIAREGYSRMPVYRESVDDIEGVLYTRDALMAAARGEAFDLADRLHPVYFVPETKKLDELLREMQAQELQMAIVNDEYGGTAGLVTVEDVLEQIVGEIRDESDEEVEAIRKESEDRAVVDAMATIEDVNDELDLALPVDGYQTMGGLVMNRLGRTAKPGDVIGLEGVRITVRTVKGIRVQQVLVEVTRPAEPPAPPIPEEA